MEKRKGLTLIEVIVSVALLGIIAMVFLNVFNTGNKNIIRSGNRTDDVIIIEKKIHEAINEAMEDPDNEELERKLVTITIEGIGELEVEVLQVTESNEEHIQITTFIPVVSE